LKGHDYLLLSQYFAHTLAPGGRERLARDARDYQLAVAASDGEVTKAPTRLTSPQEDEQTQEIREEIQSKFARVSDRLPQEFLISNFDHLDNPLDLDLLIINDEDEETQVQQEESYVSQELPEVMQPAKRATKMTIKGVAVERSKTPPPRVQQTHVAATSPAVPSSSNDDIESARGRTELHQSDAMKVTAGASLELKSTWLAGQIFCFDADKKGDLEDRKQVRDTINKSGGATVCPGPGHASMETAVSVSSTVICDQRAGDLYSIVSCFSRFE